MAVYKLFPYKDTSLYSMYPTMNTGIDPINQVSNLNFAVDSSPSVARTLIAFDTTEIQNIINNKVNGSWDAYLKSYIATAQGVVEDSGQRRRNKNNRNVIAWIHKDKLNKQKEMFK